MLRLSIIVAVGLLGLGLSPYPPYVHAESRWSASENVLSRATLAPMIEKVIPAVVSIRVKGFQAVEQNPLYNHPLFGHLVTAESIEQKQFLSSGSGVVVDPARGLVLTNFHVIEKAKEIKVHFQDGREFEGKLLAATRPPMSPSSRSRPPASPPSRSAIRPRCGSAT